MRPKFQSRQEVIINVPLERVWELNQDLTKIADYHPNVKKVDLISDKQFREEGVSYQCNLIDGKNKCIEKDIEIVHEQKLVTEMVHDTLGITKLLPDYIVETIFSKIDEQTTKIEMLHFYSTTTFCVKLLNYVIIKRKMAKQTQGMLNALKKWIESSFVKPQPV
jgi:uncharacterized protein YndB with AHSA1/START domain